MTYFFSQIYTDEQNTQRPTETLSQPISQSVTANLSGKASVISVCRRRSVGQRPLPLPLPQREGRNHRDTPMANHQHLTTINQHPISAITLCEICMPEAFCGIETVRKKALLDL